MVKTAAKTAATMKAKKAPMKKAAKAAATMKAEKLTKATKGEITVPVAQTLIRAYNSNIDISLHHKKLTEFLTEDLANAGLAIKKVSMKATNVKKVIHEDIAIVVAQTLNMTYNLNIDISKGASYPRVTSFLVHQLGEAGLSIVHL